MKMDQVTSYFE